MEQGLRDCCRSIRIGKILVESDAETHVAKVVYARFPDDIAKRQVLLMYPIMSTGNTVVQVMPLYSFNTKNQLSTLSSLHISDRLWMYLRSTAFMNRQSFYRISFAHHKRQRQLSPLFQPWKFSHPNYIRWHPIILGNVTLAPIECEPYWLQLNTQCMTTFYFLLQFLFVFI